MNEIWKDIIGYEGLYKVSNLGNIFSIKSNMIMKRVLDNHGYVIVSLYMCGKSKTYRVHKILSSAFMCHKSSGMSSIIDHINGDKLDNRLCNLQITNQRHNSSKDRKHKSSKYTGVSYYTRLNKWRSQIYIGTKAIHIGLFDTEEEAYKAYLSKIP